MRSSERPGAQPRHLATLTGHEAVAASLQPSRTGKILLQIG
jgi:hypothetical protein